MIASLHGSFVSYYQTRSIISMFFVVVFPVRIRLSISTHTHLCYFANFHFEAMGYIVVDPSISYFICCIIQPLPEIQHDVQNLETVSGLHAILC